MYGTASYGSESYGGKVETLTTYVLNFLVNTKLTPIFVTLAAKAFLENTKLTTIFSTSLVMIKTFA